MNQALEFRVLDEYYKLDLEIEVSGEEEDFQTNTTNWTLELRQVADRMNQDLRKIVLSESGLGILGM
ncbi:hypothetical protein RclHR1_03230012 [Rhizophagus clarus]|uniref:Uncharacterized protein n=1 Tax=Rhizophagus clarus TaxID=94130 RepID=A0A2Z6RK10_9GLOM|nr:hypothetical protein RclHR1_03230012 [Rhizophagus clarus]